MGFNSLQDLWSSVCEECKTMISDVSYNTWIKDLVPVKMSNDTLLLSIYTPFKKDVVESNFMPVLEKCVKSVSGLDLKIEIFVSVDEPVEIPTENPQYNEPLEFSSLYTFDNYVVGNSNRFAHAISLSVAENPGGTYNPLFIYGNSGVGKTHLLLAIKNHINRKYPQKKVEFICCEEFTNAFIESLHNGTISLFHQKFRTVDVLLIDDIQFIAGKTSTQEEIFNTFNVLYNENKQIVFTSDRPPKEIATLNDRIRNRFESGVMADVEPPDFETRVGIIHKKAREVNIELPENITYYIAEQIKMNSRQLEGIVKKAKFYVDMQKGKPVNETVIKNFIKDLINEEREDPLTIDEVISEVSRTFGVSKEDIFSKRKTQEIVYARQVSMYIIREISQMKYKEIGRLFGKDHSTVLYTIDKVKKKLEQNEQQRNLVEDIIKNLQR